MDPVPSRRPSWIARLRRVMAARADPTRIGDASILQSDLIGAAYRPGPSGER